MSRIIAIGDIHGCLQTLETLLYDYLKIKDDDQLIFLGDYINRGPDSTGVLDLLVELKNQNPHWVFLRGNHEDLLIGFLTQRSSPYSGKAIEPLFLANLKCSSWDELRTEYLQFIMNTQHFHRTNTHIFVHAGLNFSLDDPFTDLHSMMWIREMPEDPAALKNATLIHGHTPWALKKILGQQDSILNIDGGCVYKGQKPGCGYLVGYIVNDGSLVYCENADQ